MTTPARDSVPVVHLIRQRVRDRLQHMPAFQALSEEQRRGIAHDTVNALRYILCGEDGKSHPQSVVLGGNSAAFAPAQVLADAPLAGELRDTALTPASRITTIGKQTSPAGRTIKPVQQPAVPGFGDASRAGGAAFSDLVANVDFPSFVGGLIDGVFNSIVTTSIQQMEAYAEMVRNVSKSVDQYMKDNVTENNARDYLADRYPDHLEVDIGGEKPTLKPKEGHDESALPDFFADLGLQAPVESLDEDNVEQTLVPAARRRIAMDRQQTLATMVMMGVNRLVVTNGTIEASCLFELDTTDVRTRHGTRTSDYERERESTGERSSDSKYTHSNKDAGINHTRNWLTKSTSRDLAKFKIHTASDRADEQTIDLHAKLGGKVKVNFKSDYFPMEKMIDVLQVNQIREKTAAGIAPTLERPAPLPPPPPPPMPALPSIQPPAAMPPRP
jgi:hypothetical protein